VREGSLGGAGFGEVTEDVVDVDPERFGNGGGADGDLLRYDGALAPKLDEELDAKEVEEVERAGKAGGVGFGLGVGKAG